MHILIVPSWYVTEYDTVRGQFFRQQALALKRSGLQVGVIAPTFRSLRLMRQGIAGWPMGLHVQDDQGIPTYRHYNWAWLSKLGRLHHDNWIRTGRRLFDRYVADWGFPDLIHAHAAHYAGVLAADIKERHGLPYAITEHSSIYARGLVPSWQGPLIRNALAQADARLVVSPELGKLLSQQFGDAAVPWSWVPNIVDGKFRPAVPPVEKSPDDPFQFLHVAFMTANKGQAGLLRAFAARFQGDPTVRLRIGGDGPLRADLQKLALDLGIGPQVAFLGMLNQEQVIAEMQQADAFVLASQYETFGVVLIEALACGAPIVATASGGPECIVGPSNGLLVPPGDVDALGAAMVQMRETATLYAPETLHEECMAQFGEQAVAAQLDQIYHSVLREPA